MNIDDYQKKAASYFYGGGGDTSDTLGLSLGVCGEAGELAEKIKKLYFNKKMKMTDHDKELITKEMGDTLWYLAALADRFDVRLSDIIHDNIEKLESRKERDLLSGDGDER